MIRRILRRLLRGPDITDGGERVDIHYKGVMPDWETLGPVERSHIRRYQFATTFVQPSFNVGDMASGSGYGSAMLAEKAVKVFGYDIDSVAVGAASKRYRSLKNLSFVEADLLNATCAVPLDMIVSFETVEHFTPVDVPKLFKKFNSLLKPGGTLLFSTPYAQPENEASRKFHRSFEIVEANHTQWAQDAGFAVEQFAYQNYQHHDPVAHLDEKHFIICRAVKQ